MKKLKNAFYILLPIILGSIIGLTTSKYIDYQYLNKPLLSPPKILFPIMWSIIYILLGISYYLYKKKTDKTSYVYYVGLFVNLMWTILFFVFKLRFVSIIWILLLDILVYLILKEFKKVNKISFYLNIPYFIWCLFATYLTIGIYILN